ncbi:MAG: hypothetical protein ABIG28_01735 [archaeon]
MEKRGQTTIFIVIAILIVFVGIFIYLFVPEVRTVFSGEVNPSNYLMSCIEGNIREGIEVLSKQGGYMNPEGYILYEGNRVKYLCYTSEYHKMCVVQQPMIKNHFEREISEIVKKKADECAGNLAREYEKRGYDVSGFSESGASVLLVPEHIIVRVNAPMTITKEDMTQSFSDFNIEISSDMYELLMIAHSIVDYESTYGDSETSLYTQYYPDLIPRKTKLGDGSTIYKLESIKTGEKFVFASRSLAWPGGFGYEA